MMWRILIVCAALAGCSSSNEGFSTSELVDRLRGIRPDLNPRFEAQLRASAPSLQVGFAELETSANLLLERRDGDFEYWISFDGKHIVLQSGMLHGTRGFGEGLLASELSEPLALIGARRGGFADRFHTYLDGNDRAITRTYRCLIEVEGRRDVTLLDGTVSAVFMTESCRSLDQSFRNFYWISPASGEILQSRQWAGPEIGLVSTRVVNR